MRTLEHRWVRCFVTAGVLLAVAAVLPTCEAAVRVFCLRSATASDGTDFRWRIENKPTPTQTCTADVDAVNGETMQMLAVKWAASIETTCTGVGGTFQVESATVLNSGELGANCPAGFQSAGFQVAALTDFNHAVGPSGMDPPSTECNCQENNPDICEGGEQQFGSIPRSPGFCNFNPDVSQWLSEDVPALGRWGYVALVGLVLAAGIAILRLRF